MNSSLAWETDSWVPETVESSVSECSIKKFPGGMFPEPSRYLAPLALPRRLAVSKNVTPGAFRNMSATLQNCPVKTLVSVGQRKLVSQPGGWASFLRSFVQSFS